MPRDPRHLEELVDEERLDDLLTLVTPQEIAETWMRYQRTYERMGNPGTDDPDWWAVELWMTEPWWDDESRVRDGILRLVELAESDNEYGVLGAAIMEEFVSDNESRIIWIEQRAAASEKFRRSLANVCIWDEPEWVLLRVERAAETRLPRPRR